MTQNTEEKTRNITPEKDEAGMPVGHDLRGTSWAARLAGLSLGQTRTSGGLTLYPLLGERDGSIDYRTLDDALAAGVLTIGEIGASGTVPELELKNAGDRRVLLLDGEELIGAKQNRIVNTSVLVEAGEGLMLPVSCVEAGRWHAESAAFHSNGTHYNARGRQKKVAEVSASLAVEGLPRADQGRVWADVDAKLSRLAVGSETRALSAVATARGADLEGFLRALGKPLAREVGAVYALGREIVGLDLFDQAPAQAALLPKLVTSYALDAIDERHTAAPPPPAVVSRWLESVKAAAGTVRPGVGLGDDVRLSAPGISGAALVFQGTVVHLSAFQAEREAAAATSGMAPSSVRRRV